MWLGACVGEGNLPLFLLTLIHVVLGAAYVALLSLAAAAHAWSHLRAAEGTFRWPCNRRRNRLAPLRDDSTPPPCFLPGWLFIIPCARPLAWTDDAWPAVLTYVLLGVVGLVGQLLARHAGLLAQGITTIEQRFPCKRGGGAGQEEQRQAEGGLATGGDDAGGSRAALPAGAPATVPATAAAPAVVPAAAGAPAVAAVAPASARAEVDVRWRRVFARAGDPLGALGWRLLMHAYGGSSTVRRLVDAHAASESVMRVYASQALPAIAIAFLWGAYHQDSFELAERQAAGWVDASLSRDGTAG